MNRIALSVIGGVMGFAAGLLAVRPVGAFFKPTSVTWNASSCPPGVYGITSIARDQFGFAVQSVTTKNVSLPTSNVTQEFANLAPGEWKVYAIATSADGNTFGSATQTIVGNGDGSIRSGRARPPETPVTGFASSRTERPATPPTEPRLVAPIASTTRAIDLASIPGWRTLLVEDTDGDGIDDIVSIEWADGSLTVVRLAGPSRVR